MEIELEKLQFEKSINYHDDTLIIFTRRGIYHPDIAIGNKCTIAELPCCDATDMEACEHQIVSLFVAAPDLLKALKGLLSAINNPNPDSGENVAFAENEALEAIARAEGKK